MLLIVTISKCVYCYGFICFFFSFFTLSNKSVTQGDQFFFPFSEILKSFHYVTKNNNIFLIPIGNTLLVFLRISNRIKERTYYQNRKLKIQQNPNIKKSRKLYTIHLQQVHKTIHTNTKKFKKNFIGYNKIQISLNLLSIASY